MKWDVTDFVILSSIVLALPLADKSIMINNNSVQTLSSNQTPLLIKKANSQDLLLRDRFQWYKK